MRTRHLLLGALLLFAACASPLDESLESDRNALRAGDPTEDLPTCAGADLSSGDVRITALGDGLYVASSGDEPLCLDDRRGLVESGLSHEAVDDADGHGGGENSTTPTEGTPLPAVTDDGDGTPLPARR
jgi:hypothetical protein